MDNRRLVVAMVVAMAIVLFWQPALYFIGKQMGYDLTPPKPPASATRPVAQATQPVSQAAVPATSAATTAPLAAAATSASGPAMAAAPVRVAPVAETPTPAELGSAVPYDKTYPLAVTVSPRGAGIDQVVLNQFKRASGSNDPYVFQHPYAGYETISRSLATRSVTVNGTPVDLADVNWTRESASGQSATYSVTLTGDTGPMVRVRKVFEAFPSSDPSRGYELAITQSFENLTDRPLTISTVLNGPTMPPQEQERGGDRQVLVGHVERNYVTVSHDLIESFVKDKAVRDYTKDKDGNPLAWAGTASIYFNALVHPLPEEPGKPVAGYLAKVTAEAVNADAPSHEERKVALTFATTDLTVAPGQTATVPVRAFFGPRQRSLLNSKYYSAFPLSYDQTLVLTSGPCAFCTFQWLINLLVWLLQAFWFISRDWGIAIILLVVLIRLLLHPISKKSQVNMAKMSKMGPEMERLKKKYGDNKEELNKAMMQFYKEQGFTPVLGCLPMVLQMPIWIALWQAMQTTFELRQAPFLHPFGIHLTWINDLSKPDHLIELAHPVQILFFTVTGLNVLPLLLALVFWLQMKFQPKPVSMTKEQEQQQKMMQWLMPVLFPLMFYNGPSGLNLYILTSTIIGIWESKKIRDHIREREEAEKAGLTIIDAKPTRGSKLTRKDKADRTEPARPRTGLMGWIAELQDKADQVRKKDGGR